MSRLLSFFLFSLPICGQIITAYGDNSRANGSTSETILNPSVAASTRKLGTYLVDGAIYHQPLYVTGSPNRLIVGTMHGTVYAFPADNPGASYLWKAGPFATSWVNGSGDLYGGEIGCMSAPVVDIGASAVFAVCATSAPSWVLYKISLSTGAILASVTIAGQVPGTGDSGDVISSGNLVFTAANHLQRAALTLANGRVYVGFASSADTHPWHGWLMAYSSADLSSAGVFCTTPNGFGGGIWESGGGPAVDSSGNLYFATGNGTYDGTANFGSSVLKLSPALALLDWFTPSNFATLTANDSDLGSGRVMLLGGLAVFGAKDFNVYSVNSGCMGHLGGMVGGCHAPQIFPTNAAGQITSDTGIYGGMFLNGRGYFPNTGGKFYAFTLSGSTWNTSPATSSAAYAFPGAQMTGAGQLVWAVTVPTSASQMPTHGTLRAFAASTLSELWNSDGHSNDSLGNVSKFAAPTIANGRVYVSIYDNAVQVFGLAPSAAVRGQAVIRGQSAVR